MYFASFLIYFKNKQRKIAFLTLLLCILTTITLTSVLPKLLPETAFFVIENCTREFGCTCGNPGYRFGANPNFNE